MLTQEARPSKTKSSSYLYGTNPQTNPQQTKSVKMTQTSFETDFRDKIYETYSPCHKYLIPKEVYYKIIVAKTRNSVTQSDVSVLMQRDFVTAGETSVSHAKIRISGVFIMYCDEILKQLL